MKRTITGIRARLVRRSIRISVFLIALFHFRNPLTALKVMAAVKNRRKDFRGPQKFNKFISSGGRYFFLDNIPGWPSKAFNGYFRGEAIRLKTRASETVPLSTVFISITSKCPMRCRHCFELSNLSPNEHLTLEDLKSIVRKLKDYGVNHIQFSGGEPLERFDDLISLTEYSRKNTDIWLNTSGFGLTAEKARLLKKTGLTGAEISLDHWNELEHNRFRGYDKSFYWAREAVSNCNNAGLLTCLSLCATNKFVSEENLKRYASLAKEWKVNFIRLLEPRETSTYKGEDVILSPQQVHLLEQFFLNSTMSDTVIEYPIISYPYYHQRRTGCLGAGNRYLYIDSRGDVHACPFCRNAAGNMVNDNIENIVRILRERGCQAYYTDTREHAYT